MNIYDKILLLAELIRNGAEFEIAIGEYVCDTLVYKIKNNTLMVKNKGGGDFDNSSVWSIDLLFNDIIGIRELM